MTQMTMIRRWRPRLRRAPESFSPNESWPAPDGPTRDSDLQLPQSPANSEQPEPPAAAATGTGQPRRPLTEPRQPPRQLRNKPRTFFRRLNVHELRPQPGSSATMGHRTGIRCHLNPQRLLRPPWMNLPPESESLETESHSKSNLRVNDTHEKVLDFLAKWKNNITRTQHKLPKRVKKVSKSWFESAR
jgi:hypothetical protein